MHVFTRPSQQLRRKVRAATLRSLHQTSLYKRLILLAKEKGACIAEMDKALHIRLMHNPADDTNLLKLYSHTASFTMAKSPIDMGTLQRTNAHSATSLTRALT